MVRVTTSMLGLGLAILGWTASARSQEIEPRAYSNIPLGVNFAAVAYSHSEGGLATDPSLPLDDASLSTDAVVVGFARALELGGQSGKFDVALPYAFIDGSAQLAGEAVQRRVAGLGDPRVRVAINLFGAPALALKDFATFRQRTIVGVSLQAGLPLGQYDDRRVVNVGSNRWWLKPELGASTAIGAWTLELAVAASVFGDNDDFRGLTREQAPIYSVQGGVVYGLRRGAWLALHGTYYTGGRTTVDGVEGDDLQRNSAVRLTLAWPLSARDSLKFFAGTGVSTRTGVDSDTLSVAWQRRWGGGL